MSDIDKLIQEISPHYKKKKEPSSEHKLVYDSTTETLEPIYFWILDFMNGMFRGDVTKVIDNFASSPGSGHFGEIGQKASVMQQQAMNIMGQVNTVLKSVINLIYDLKEFQIRLKNYEDANSDDKSKAEYGNLTLKQIWMDQVDIKRGQGSINGLASGNLQFITLRDAFMAIKSPEDVDKKDVDLNERVKRILKPRLAEFIEWKKRSGQELTKRFEIERSYLKSQVNTLKLYARWAKPYLKATQQLESNEKLGENPALVNIFNTLMLELTILGKSSVNVKEAVITKDLPKDFAKIKKLRKYYSIVVIDFNFRGIPSKAGQHYVFGGRAEVTFKSYTLNEDELTLLKDKLDKSDLEDSLKLIQGMTDESLMQLNQDIEDFLDSEKKAEKEKAKFEEEDTNPFSALFSGLKWKKKEKPKEEDKSAEKLKQLKERGIKKDNYSEEYIRSMAEAGAINSCFSIFDIYKKAHGMAAFPYAEEAETKAPQTEAEKWFGFK